MRSPLAMPALLMAGGVAVSRLAGLSAAEALVCLFAGMTGRLAARGAASKRLSAWTAWAAVGALAAALQPRPAAPEMDLTPRPTAGCVVESSVIRGERMQFTVEFEAGARARVSWPPAKDGAFPPPLLYGERVRAELRLRPVRGFRNPGGFDAAAYMARKGVFWPAVPGKGAQLEVLPGACGAAWRRPLERLRAAALERIDRVNREDAVRAAMMRGLLLGDKSGIKGAWVEDFRRTGTYHALVISGSHVTLVCGLFLLWRRVSGIGWRAVLLAAVAVAWAYALMAGAEPPVLRAAAGFTLFAAGGLFYRRLALLNVTGAVAILFLALDPDQLFDGSFQLSFLAVAALGALAAQGSGTDKLGVERGSGRRRQPMGDSRARRLAQEAARRLGEAGLKAWRWAKALFLASAAVQWSLALPMALLFHRLPVTGLSANALAVPFVSLAIPAGFAAAITGWEGAGRLAGWLLDIARLVAAWHARVEPVWPIPAPPLWLAAAVAAALLGWAAARGRVQRWAAGIVYTALLALVAAHPFRPRAARGVLELTAIDVGQGESLLLGLPDGRFALVDAGGLPQPGRKRAEPFDVGEEVVSPYLWHRGIRRLEAILITHLHDDHAAGAPSLIRNFRPREVWTSFTPDTALWQEIGAAAREAGSRVRVLREGDDCSMGEVRCRVLAPPREQAWRGSARNEDSLVLELRYGRRTLLLTGDIEAKREAELAEAGLVGPAEILKAPHHGGRMSATARLLEAARPAVALISAGEANPYGLPHREALARLREARALVLRTDLQGPVTVRTNGRWVETEASAGSGLLRRFLDWE